MPTMEQVIRPFQGESVGPEPYVPPGGESNAPALVQVGLTGGTKIFPGNFQYTCTTKLGAVHTEAPSSSQTIQKVIANPSALPGG